MTNITILDKPYIYIVVEHATATEDAVIHGVYTTKESAYGKAAKLKSYRTHLLMGGYIAVLKKPLIGPKKTHPKFERSSGYLFSFQS